MVEDVDGSGRSTEPERLREDGGGGGVGASGVDAEAAEDEGTFLFLSSSPSPSPPSSPWSSGITRSGLVTSGSSLISLTSSDTEQKIDVTYEHICLVQELQEEWIGTFFIVDLLSRWGG